MCTFDIVLSLGPQSQVLHPVEASVFIQFSIPSSRSAIDTHHRHRLQTTPLLCSHGNGLAPATGALHPITGAARDRAQRTIPGSRSGDQVKGPLAPTVTYSPTPVYVEATFQHTRTISYMYSHTPNLTHKVAIACINNDNYGKQGIR